MEKLKKGDKVIILDYNNKPLVPHVVAEIEEVVDKKKVRLLLPDGACCYEYMTNFKKIDEDTYEKDLHAVREREKELPMDLSMDIRKFASDHPRLQRDIYKNFQLDKQYVSILHAYAGRLKMYGHDNIPKRFLYDYEAAKEGIVKTRSFFHDLDESINEIQVV